MILALTVETGCAVRELHVVRGRLFCVCDGGSVICLDNDTGEKLREWSTMGAKCGVALTNRAEMWVGRTRDVVVLEDDDSPTAVVPFSDETQQVVQLREAGGAVVAHTLRHHGSEIVVVHAATRTVITTVDGRGETYLTACVVADGLWCGAQTRAAVDIFRLNKDSDDTAPQIVDLEGMSAELMCFEPYSCTVWISNFEASNLIIRDGITGAVHRVVEGDEGDTFAGLQTGVSWAIAVWTSSARAVRGWDAAGVLVSVVSSDWSVSGILFTLSAGENGVWVGGSAGQLTRYSNPPQPHIESLLLKIESQETEILKYREVVAALQQQAADVPSMRREVDRLVQETVARGERIAVLERDRESELKIFQVRLDEANATVIDAKEIARESMIRCDELDVEARHWRQRADAFETDLVSCREEREAYRRAAADNRYDAEVAKARATANEEMADCYLTTVDALQSDIVDSASVYQPPRWNQTEVVAIEGVLLENEALRSQVRLLNTSRKPGDSSDLLFRSLMHIRENLTANGANSVIAEALTDDLPNETAAVESLLRTLIHRLSSCT